jgi:hypothetical protein
VVVLVHPAVMALMEEQLHLVVLLHLEVEVVLHLVEVV